MKNKNLDQIVKTTDENGIVHSFKLVEIVEFDKKEYGLFEYLDPEQKDHKPKLYKPDEELIVMRILHKKGEYYFEVIEDEEEFNNVLEYIEEHEDELEFE